MRLTDQQHGGRDIPKHQCNHQQRSVMAQNWIKVVNWEGLKTFLLRRAFIIWWTMWVLYPLWLKSLLYDTLPDFQQSSEIQKTISGIWHCFSIPTAAFNHYTYETQLQVSCERPLPYASTGCNGNLDANWQLCGPHNCHFHIGVHNMSTRNGSAGGFPVLFQQLGTKHQKGSGSENMAWYLCSPQNLSLTNCLNPIKSKQPLHQSFVQAAQLTCWKCISTSEWSFRSWHLPSSMMNLWPTPIHTWKD